MELIGFTVSIIAGILLGLLGGGGSVLAVPVLVYLFGFNVLEATLYSLFIVGVSSFGAAFSYLKEKLVNFRVFILFGAPSLLAVFLVRSLLLPEIPDIICVSSFCFSKRVGILVLFAGLMLLAAISMIKDNRNTMVNADHKGKDHIVILLLQGLITGALTALVGAGGGFLIVPALVLLARLAIKEAIGTSLMIISVQSIVGFVFDGSLVQVKWTFLLLLTTLTVLGMQLGVYLSKRIDSRMLKPIFGWFVLVLAIFILLQELVFV